MKSTTCLDEMKTNVEANKYFQLTELVRGSDRRLIEEMEPLVRRQDVSLDLTSVERIDAAGIAALISLYRMAEVSGHSFSIARASARVDEMLTLVGLDGILLSHNAKCAMRSRSSLAQNAA
jgi:anti-anti-sigma factor